MNEDYLNDGFITVKDRVSPNIKSGSKYDKMVGNLKEVVKHLRSIQRFKNKFTIEYEHFDEWYGFRVTDSNFTK